MLSLMYRVERGIFFFFALQAVAALLVEESGQCAWLIAADGRFVFVCLSVAIMHWTRDERSFCVEAYFLNAHSIIAVQRAFRLRFRLRTKYAVLE